MSGRRHAVGRHRKPPVLPLVALLFVGRVAVDLVVASTPRVLRAAQGTALAVLGTVLVVTYLAVGGRS